MSKRFWFACMVVPFFLFACGGDTEEGDGLPPTPAESLEALATNTATVACDVITADDLSVESCNRVVNIWLITMRKSPHAVILGIPSIEAGTYEADGGGRGLAITLTDATDISDVVNYGIGKLKVVLEESDGVFSGTYEGEVMKDYVVPIPIQGAFRFDRSKVSE